MMSLLFIVIGFFLGTMTGPDTNELQGKVDDLESVKSACVTMKMIDDDIFNYCAEVSDALNVGISAAMVQDADMMMESANTLNKINDSVEQKLSERKDVIEKIGL